MTTDTDIAGVVLAGGRGTRFGGLDKGWIEYAGRPLIEAVIERFAPQVGPLALSVNRNRRRYVRLGLTMLGDPECHGPPGSQGPLAGVHSALAWCPLSQLVCVPCDLPRLPEDLVARLSLGRMNAPAAYAVDGQRSHYLCCILSARLAPALSDYLAGGGRAVYRWFETIGAVAVDCSDAADAFVNVNTPSELSGGEVG